MTMKAGLAILFFTLLIASSYGTKCRNAVGSKQCKINMQNDPLYCETPDARDCQKQCDICDNYCYMGDYRNYEGTVSHTVSGVECQRWDSDSPHVKDFGQKPSDFPDGVFPENYCRGFTGDGETQPWCYTTDPSTRYEYCGITKCGSKVFRGKVADLQTKLEKLEARLNSLDTTIGTQGTQIGTLDTQVSTLDATVGTQGTVITQHTGQLSTQGTQLQTLATKVYFSAGLTHHAIATVNEIIIFGLVISNVGGGYDNDTGVFTSPEAGDYMFNVNELGSFNKKSRLILYHNDQRVIQMYATKGQGYSAASNTAIISLNKGDTVTVKAGWDEIAYAHGMLENTPYTTFNGLLLGAK